jgi:hypothetical protein
LIPSDRPVRGAAVDFAPVAAGHLPVALPGAHRQHLFLREAKSSEKPPPCL